MAANRIGIEVLRLPWWHSTRGCGRPGLAVRQYRTMDLAMLLVELSVSTWRTLDDAGKAGFSPREETLTENILIQLSSLAPAQVRVRKTTGFEESRTGSDFALALEVEPGRWLNLVVQAKKLSRSGMYTEFRKAEARQQADHLLAEAALVGALPAYVFFNGSELAPLGAILGMGGCRRNPLVRQPSGPPWVSNRQTPAGCTIVHAERVEEMLAQRPRPTHPQDFSRTASPWECLLCPFGDGGGGFPDVLSGLNEGAGVTWLGAPPDWARSLIWELDPEALENVEQPVEVVLPAVSHLIAVRQSPPSQNQ